MTEHGTYFYAVGRGRAADATVGVLGVADAPVRALEHGDLTAFVSTVDLTEFGEDGLRRNLEDLSWLETVARAHDRVVDTVGSAGVCAPLRLATIFLGDDSVHAELDARHDELERTLARVEGRVEHGVKVYVDATPDATTGGRDADAKASGAAYLLRRREELAHRERASHDAAALGDDVHTELAAQVVASRRYPPQEQRLSGHQGQMILNGAYLVEETRSADLEALVAGLGERHPEARFELTGPWPPYSFTDLESP